MLAFCFPLFVGCNQCTSSNTPAAVQAVLQPLASAGCSIENSFIPAATATVAKAFNCSNSAAITASIQSVTGNVALCSTAAGMSARMRGPIGNLACPLAVNAVMGFLTAPLPPAWGCSVPAQANSLMTVLTTACEAAVPI